MPEGVEKKFPCSKCSMAFETAQGRGSHMRSTHKIKGTSPSTVAWRKAKKAINGKDKSKGKGKTKRKYTKQENLPAVITPERHSHAEQEPSQELVYAVALGAIQEHCRHLAEEHGQPTRLFTQQLARLLLSQASR